MQSKYSEEFCSSGFFWNIPIKFCSRSKEKEEIKKCGNVSNYESLLEQFKFELANAIPTHLEGLNCMGHLQMCLGCSPTEF